MKKTYNIPRRHLFSSTDDLRSNPRSNSHLGSISTVVGRAKARWINRVMRARHLTPTAKCLAYWICDHLNCVTLDCWPSQSRLAEVLSTCCTKTVSRASQCLETAGFLIVTRQTGKRAPLRYSPNFEPGDWDTNVSNSGPPCPKDPDTDVAQSFLSIQSKSFSKVGLPTSEPSLGYRLSHQGAFEKEIASRLGTDGWEILQQLASLDDAIVARMCKAQATGVLSDRDLVAAKLAAKQFR